MRFNALWIAVAALSILMSCATSADDTPLRGMQGGLSALRWGDGPEDVQRRMLEMPGVTLTGDTVEIHAFAAWKNPDTVEVPSYIPRFRMLEFRGGTFLGHPVAWWLVTLDDGTSFRQLQVGLASLDDAGEAQWRIRRQLQRLYRRPNEPDLDRDRFFADDWATPATSASTARMAVEVGRYGSDITVGFVDRPWDDRRWPSRPRQRRRMQADEWRKYLADLAKQRGWKLEELPPQ
jgi:hypothetical protein